MLPTQNDPSLKYVPPNSIDAEESIIASILINNDTIPEILEILQPAHFYKTANKKIFSAVTEMFERGENVDLVTLTNKLKENGNLERIGGATYLAKIIDTVPLAVNAVSYANIIYEQFCKRYLIEKSADITKRCFSPGTLKEIVNFAEGAIFEALENKNKNSFHPINTLADHHLDLIETRLRNRAEIIGAPSGYPDVDKITSGFQNSDLIILAGRPGMGKTAFALNVALHMTLKRDLSVGMFSLEMSKEQLTMRLFSILSSVNSTSIKNGFLNKQNIQAISDAGERLSKAKLFIDDSPDISALDIRIKARRLKKQHKIDLLIIDYLQLIRTKQNAERRDIAVSDVSRSLKILAKELNIPVIALSQLNRKVEDRTDKRPQLADLRESGAIEQDADLVAFIYRDDVYNKDIDNPKKGQAEIIVAKHRNGPSGTAILLFQSAYTRFANLSLTER